MPETLATAPARRSRPAPCYAAIDLGTNNCRLLVASPARGGLRVVDSFSRIVRLGEGLSRTGRLDAAAQDRAVAALAVCAEKIRRRRPVQVRAVATQACRMAEDGAVFVARVEAETGLALDIIAPDEEARLSVAGCRDLFDPAARAVLVLDVGGGSTELSWFEPDGRGRGGGRLRAWLSLPIGVVGLAERFPEPEPATAEWFDAMVVYVRERLAAFPEREALATALADGGHLVGTSGAITSLAGLHLDLARYDRARVDGLWLSPQDCSAAVRRLMATSPESRARAPCIGPDRADLVLAGAAILQAVQDAWPCARVRVADRGLREGLLLEMMAERDGGRGPRRG